jgi:hypothetical protein
MSMTITEFYDTHKACAKFRALHNWIAVRSPVFKGQATQLSRLATHNAALQEQEARAIDALAKQLRDTTEVYSCLSRQRDNIRALELEREHLLQQLVKTKKRLETVYSVQFQRDDGGPSARITASVAPSNYVGASELHVIVPVDHLYLKYARDFMSGARPIVDKVVSEVTSKLEELSRRCVQGDL